MVLSERGEQFLLLHCVIIDIFLSIFNGHFVRVSFDPSLKVMLVMDSGLAL